MKVKVVNAQTQVEIQKIDLQDSLNRNSECLLGRSPNSGLILESVDVSRLHAKFALEQEQYFFYDLGSANGSLLNGAIAQANHRYLLQPGDIIRIGEFVLMLEAIAQQPEDLPATVIGDPDATVIGGRDLSSLSGGQEDAQVVYRWMNQVLETSAAPEPAAILESDPAIAPDNEINDELIAESVDELAVTDSESLAESLDSLNDADPLLVNDLRDDSSPSVSEELSETPLKEISEESYEDAKEAIEQHPDSISELEAETEFTNHQVELSADIEAEDIEAGNVETDDVETHNPKTDDVEADEITGLDHSDSAFDQTIFQSEELTDTPIVESTIEVASTPDSIVVQPNNIDDATVIQLNDEANNQVIASLSEQNLSEQNVSGQSSTPEPVLPQPLQPSIESVLSESTEIQAADAIELSEVLDLDLPVVSGEPTLPAASITSVEAASDSFSDADSDDIEELDPEEELQLSLSSEAVTDKDGSDWDDEIDVEDCDSTDPKTGDPDISNISDLSRSDLSSADQRLAEQIALSATAAVLSQGSEQVSKVTQITSLDNSDTLVDKLVEAESSEDIDPEDTAISVDDTKPEETVLAEAEDSVADELTEPELITDAATGKDDVAVNIDANTLMETEQSIAIDIEDSVESVEEATLTNQVDVIDEGNIDEDLQEDTVTGVGADSLAKTDSGVVEVPELAPEIVSSEVQPEAQLETQLESVPEVVLEIPEIPESAAKPDSIELLPAVAPSSVLQEKYVVLLAHESQEIDLIHLIERHRSLLSCCQTLTTPALSESLKQQIGFSVSQQTPPLLQGGYQFVNGLITANKILAVLFFRDFLTPQSTQANEDALSRSCNVYQVLLASNLPTAEAIVSYLQSHVASNSFYS